MTYEALLIAGPTASGKSRLAVEIARETGGTVVNADAMQVYRDLRIVTARPGPDDEAAAPHRLFGHVDGAVNFSVGRYLDDASALLGTLGASLPIVVGGTGLYLRALRDGLSEIPPVPDAIRARVRAEAEGVASPDLHAALARRDPEDAARLRPTDRQRILRALEVLAATGRPLAAFQGTRSPGPLAGRRCLAVFLAPDREALREAIDRRFERMTEAGALDEVLALAARALDPALPVMRAHGVPGLLGHLAGGVTLAEAVARGQADTRAYAKRQFTWFRHQMPDALALAPETARDRILGLLAAA